MIAKTDIRRIAKEANASFETAESMFKFAELIASFERKECAKVCEYRQDGYELSGFIREFTAARACAEAIRARGEA